MNVKLNEISWGTSSISKELGVFGCTQVAHEHGFKTNKEDPEFEGFLLPAHWCIHRCNWEKLLQATPEKKSRRAYLLQRQGDIICQMWVEKKLSWKDYDIYRTVRFTGVGMVILGPPMHVWYSALNTRIKGTTLLASCKKMFLDQLFFLPVYCVVFIVAMGLLKGEAIEDIKNTVKQDIEAIVVTSWKIWVPVQIANFKWVPAQHQVLLINLVGLIWNTYMSWKAEGAGQGFPQTPYLWWAGINHDSSDHDHCHPDHSSPFN